jgi:hypothetical protein
MWWKKLTHLMADRKQKRDKICPSKACPPVTYFLQQDPHLLKLPPPPKIATLSWETTGVPI